MIEHPFSPIAIVSLGLAIMTHVGARLFAGPEWEWYLMLAAAVLYILSIVFAAFGV